MKEPASMDTPLMPANVRSVMLKASSILKPGRGENGRHVERVEMERGKTHCSCIIAFP